METVRSQPKPLNATPTYLTPILLENCNITHGYVTHTLPSQTERFQGPPVYCVATLVTPNIIVGSISFLNPIS